MLSSVPDLTTPTLSSMAPLQVHTHSLNYNEFKTHLPVLFFTLIDSLTQTHYSNNFTGFTVEFNSHWLLATITYNSLSTSSPDYLASLISRCQPARSLRSADLQLLNLPASKTKFGSRAFRCSAPSIWNVIPLNVRNSPSIAYFKNNLKHILLLPSSCPVLSFSVPQIRIVFIVV